MKFFSSALTVLAIVQPLAFLPSVSADVSLAQSCGKDRNEPCPTEQSSDYKLDGIVVGESSLAVDSKTDQSWGGDGTITHTAEGQNGWWKVDLEALHKIDKVVIYGRNNCDGCKDRLDNLKLEVLDADEKVVKEKIWPSAPDDFIFRFDNLSSEGVIGQYVKVSNSVGPLSLAEVEVYGPMTEEPSASPSSRPSFPPSSSASSNPSAHPSSVPSFLPSLVPPTPTIVNANLNPLSGETSSAGTGGTGKYKM